MAAFGRFVEFIEFAEDVLDRRTSLKASCTKVELTLRKLASLCLHGFAFGDRGRFGGIGVREHCLRIIAPISKVRECYAGSPGRLNCRNGVKGDECR